MSTFRLFRYPIGKPGRTFIAESTHLAELTRRRDRLVHKSTARDVRQFMYLIHEEPTNDAVHVETTTET